MLTVGIRALKNKLTHYLRLTKLGERIVVTDHGHPVAILHDLSQTELNAPPDELLALASAEGHVRLPESGATIDLKTKPIPHKGLSASATVLEDRR